jgi:hypothetical protein
VTKAIALVSETRADQPQESPVLKITSSDYAPLIITPEPTQPAVYLDYCVIADLARNPITGEEFRDCLLDKGGTLYLSWAHLVELFGLGPGPTYDSIRSYLASFGRSLVKGTLLTS